MTCGNCRRTSQGLVYRRVKRAGQMIFLALCLTCAAWLGESSDHGYDPTYSTFRSPVTSVSPTSSGVPSGPSRPFYIRGSSS